MSADCFVYILVTDGVAMALNGLDVLLNDRGLLDFTCRREGVLLGNCHRGGIGDLGGRGSVRQRLSITKRLGIAKRLGQWESSVGNHAGAGGSQNNSKNNLKITENIILKLIVSAVHEKYTVYNSAVHCNNYKTQRILM